MRILRKLKILGVGCSLFLILGNISRAQDPNGGSSPTQPVNKPTKPQPLGNQGADTPSPFKAPAGGLADAIGQSQTGSLPSAVPPDLETGRHLEDQAKLRNLDRQKQLVQDTQRLLALATELKTEVDKSNKDMMSIDVIRKAETIEKLARSVKDKMKGSN